MNAYSPKTKLIYLSLIALICSACNKHKKIDVSDIQVDVKIERFDRDFDSLRLKPMDEQAGVLYKKYGVFYTDFIERILKAGNAGDTAYYTKLRAIFADRSYGDLKHDVDAIYPNLDKPTAEITDAFKHIKYFYPKQKLPKLYAYLSGFQDQVVIGEGYFGIGLDQFLGADSRFYPALTNAFPHYISRRFTPDNITPRVVEGIAREEMFPERAQDKSLLSKMIYNGKIMYYMDQIMPDVPDSTKIGYTNKQVKWCDNFKGDIWSYFLEEDLLYETDYQKLTKYLNEAPFTPGLGDDNDSAPKLGIWTGWQIVRTYMDKHPEVTLQQLMNDYDAQKILNEAKYRPKNP